MSHDIIVQEQYSAANLSMLQEASELYNLEISNSTLLDYGLRMGFINCSSSGHIIIDSLNMKLMSDGQIIKGILIEALVRLGIFLSACNLVKIAIDSKPNQRSQTTASQARPQMIDEYEDIREGCIGLYVLAILVHQVSSFDETSIRTLNRMSMTIAMILFTVTSADTKPCENMRKFKHKIRHRLMVDYYLWFLLLAMDFVLTCSSPFHTNLENVYGIELNLSHIVLSLYCSMHLSDTMQMIGQGGLTPLILGTPLIFLDAGDNITPVKAVILGFYYFRFYCSEWRELIDWNHSLLCQADICKILSQESGNLTQIIEKAKSKFDHWRTEEGLDDDGWFLILDPPLNQVNLSHEDAANENDDEDDEPSEGRANRNEQQIVDYTDRAIYLQSRNPLLTSLAVVMLLVWQ